MAAKERHDSRIHLIAPFPSLMGAPFIVRTHYEISRYRAGELIGSPFPCATLQEAQTEAAYMARGNLLNDRGDREPSLLVYELDEGEMPTRDDPEALYIRSITTRTEATVI